MPQLSTTISTITSSALLVGLPVERRRPWWMLFWCYLGVVCGSSRCNVRFPVSARRLSLYRPSCGSRWFCHTVVLSASSVWKVQYHAVALEEAQSESCRKFVYKNSYRYWMSLFSIIVCPPLALWQKDVSHYILAQRTTRSISICRRLYCGKRRKQFGHGTGMIMGQTEVCSNTSSGWVWLWRASRCTPVVNEVMVCICVYGKSVL